MHFVGTHSEVCFRANRQQTIPIENCWYEEHVQILHEGTEALTLAQ